MSELLKENINKKILIFYNDTNESVTVAKGKLLDYDETNLKIEDKNNETTIIPRNRIVRMVVE